MSDKVLFGMDEVNAVIAGYGKPPEDKPQDRGLITAFTRRIDTGGHGFQQQTLMEVADPQHPGQVFSIGMLWRENPTRYDVAYMLREMADRIARKLEQEEIKDFASGLGDVTTERLR